MKFCYKSSYDGKSLPPEQNFGYFEM